MRLINEWQFQQDNDPKNISKATQKWLVDKDEEKLRYLIH